MIIYLTIMLTYRVWELFWETILNFKQLLYLFWLMTLFTMFSSHFSKSYSSMPRTSNRFFCRLFSITKSTCNFSRIDFMSTPSSSRWSISRPVLIYLPFTLVIPKRDGPVSACNRFSRKMHNLLHIVYFHVGIFKLN